VREFKITGVEGGAAFPVVVTASAAANQVTGKDNDAFQVDLDVVSEREAVDQELINFLSEKLQLDSEKIAVVAGTEIEKKIIVVIGMNPNEIEERLLA